MYIEGLDEIDNRIVDLLKDNARLSYTEIGEAVGLSRVAAKNRIEALEEKGVILGYYAKVCETKGLDGTKFFLDIETYPNEFEGVLDSLACERMIREVYTVTGDCRVHAVGYSGSPLSLQAYVNRLYREIAGIRRLSFHTVLSTVKNLDGGVDYERSERGQETKE